MAVQICALVCKKRLFVRAGPVIEDPLNTVINVLAVSPDFASEPLHNSHQRDYFNFAYSALAAMRMGISGSASFQRVRKS
jgi:hypothetical protein